MEWAGKPSWKDCGTSRAYRHDGQAHNRRIQVIEEGLCASPKCQLGKLADSGNFTAGEIAVQIAKIGLEIVERLPLRPVIRIVLEVSEPLPLILPINVFSRFHTAYYSRALKVWEVERGNEQLNTCGSVSGNQKALFFTSDRREVQSRM